MKYINYLILFIFVVSCFESDKDSTGEVYSGHKASENLLILKNPTTPIYYKAGDIVYFILEFPMTVKVTGSPQLTIDVGGSPQVLPFFDQGIDSDEIWFEYTVLGGDIDLNGIAVTPSIDLNGGSIVYRDEFNVNLDFLETSVPNIKIDGVTPSLLATNVPTNKTYEYNDALILTLDYSEAVFIYGTLSISVDIGGQTKTFNYASGSGTSTLTFSYLVTNPNYDNDGISINTTIDVVGGAGIKDTAGNLASTTIIPGATPGILVDGDSPKVLSITRPANKTYGVGNNLSFSMTFSENVNVAVANPRIPIDVGGVTRYAIYASGTGTKILTFTYTVGVGDVDTNGILLISPFELNGSTVKDAGGRDALLTYSVPNTTFVLVDGIAPLAPSLNDSNPESPSDITTPRINGTTEAYAIVKLYSDGICSLLVDTVNASSGGTFYFDLTGLSPGVNSFWSTATDLAGNSSPCSAVSFDYELYEIPEGMGWFQGSTTVAGTDLNQVGSYFSVLWDTYLRYDSEFFTHSSTTNPERITVTQAGDYKVSINIPLVLASTAQRATIQGVVSVNGVIREDAVTESSYIRNADGHDETSTSMTILLNDLSENDYVELKLKGTTVTGAVNALDRISLNIDYIGTDSIFYAKATDVTGGTNLNGAVDSLKWLEVKKSTSFTHSDGASPENITIAESGDYLVYVNLPINSSV